MQAKQRSVSAKKSLLFICAVFLLLWVILPLAFPQTALPIYLLTLPFRLVGVLVHELGHGLGCAISGGSFFWFQLEGIQGGVAITGGGSRILTLLAGLLGPASLGALLLGASVRDKYQTSAFYVLFLLFILGAFFIVRPILFFMSDPTIVEGWGPRYLFGLILPLSMLVLMFLSKAMGAFTQRLFVQTIAVVLCFSAFSDTQYIFLYEPISPALFSDTRALAGYLSGGPERVGLLWFWLVASSVAILNFLILIRGLTWAFKSPSA